MYSAAEVEAKCSFLQYGPRFGIQFYEHPEYGDEYPVIAVKDGVAFLTDFYDPWNVTDQEYIQDALEEIQAELNENDSQL